MLKAFFEYWIVRGELRGCPMPPPRRPGTARIFVPYIYSVPELRKMLREATLRRPPSIHEFSPATFRTILLFLYGTGARINETLSLRPEDVDLKHGTVTFHRPIASRTRTIPIGTRLCESLKEYLRSLDRSAGDRTNFFVRQDGKPIQAVNITVCFQSLRRKAGLPRPTDISRQPQVRDLRRTFAVHCMRAWMKKGKDLRKMLPVLGAYLGHVSLTSTEAYLSVTPERFLVHLSRLPI
jgi:integrase/recombinase XerD